MNLWIVTIGSSDVQLDSDKVNQEKGRTEKQRSDKIWGYWYSDALKAQYHDIIFEPKPLFKDKEESYRIAPRILGAVYNASPDQVQQEILSYLTFPLLDNFVEALKQCPAPETLAVLLTDQSAIFQDDCQRRKPMSPYWQDTCELKLILQDYFENKFPCIPCEWIILDPVSEDQRLDGWDQVLQLVQTKFSVYFPKKLPKDARVYVSHQAGTPAISSAVQFCSLAKFGDRVKFLVSNEYNPTFPEKPLEGSSYLRGIRIQEAKALLGEGSYNYAGVEALIGDYIGEDEEIKMLLNAAKNWNVAKFDDFLGGLRHYPKFASELEARTSEANWWWIAYEEVYLAVIREKQENIVEAFFHSFRAFEYIFAVWGSQKLTDHIQEGEGDSVSFLKESILDDPRIIGLSGRSAKSIKKIISTLKKTRDDKSKNDAEINNNEEKVELVFFNLANLFKAFNYSEYKTSCQELEVFFGKNNVRDQRNIIIHQVKGLSVIDLCNYWGISVPADDKDWERWIGQWKSKLLKLLNFIVKEDFPEGFATLEDASLMVKVHQELEKAIADL
jgi:hypothetical protein